MIQRDKIQDGRRNNVEESTFENLMKYEMPIIAKAYSEKNTV